MTLFRSLSLGVLAVLAVLVGLATTFPRVPVLPRKEFVGGPGARPEALTAQDRPYTYVSLDKPMYRPGEQVLIRGLVLEALSRRPHVASRRGQIEITGPQGTIVGRGEVETSDSVWGYAWPIPRDLPGGGYTLVVNDPFTGTAQVMRKFDVRDYRAPRLKSQIAFLRDGYGPGDTVTATLEVQRAEGGIPEGAKVTATALVDGKSVAEKPCEVDAQGHCTVSFELPEAIERGDGTLSFTLQDGGVVETAAKTIPILLQTLDVALYPEGGDLVAGLTSRVYFEARTPMRKPADLTGAVVDLATGREVSVVRSEHEGRGRFELTPTAGVRYALRVDSPAGIKKTFPLPEVKATGAVLRAKDEVIAAGQKVRLAVDTAGVGRTKVTLNQRDVRVAEATLSEDGDVTLEAGVADGVLVATVWTEDGRPLAERLVFRQPANALSIELKADRAHHAPGDEVELTARTLRDGKPVSALVMLTVTDDAVLQLQEKREHAPLLPVMVLLEPEVKELADAHLYLDTSNPKSPLATDLLLGTQGWRRFALVDPLTFMADHDEAARRVLAAHTSRRWPPSPPEAELRRGRGTPPGAKKWNRGYFDPNAQRDLLASAYLLMEGNERPFDPARGNPLELRDALAKFEGMKVVGFSRVRDTLVYQREYAHLASPDRQKGERRDFAETLYWSAGVRTDAATGEARVRFAMSDSVTTFKAFAGAVDVDGALGASVAELESVQPFYTEPKLPLEVTSGDVVRLPVALVNGTDATLTNIAVKAEVSGDVKLTGDVPRDLAARARERRLLTLEIGQQSQPVEVKLTTSAGGHTDVVTRTLAIQAQGFPGRESFGGALSRTQPAVHTLTLPDTVDPASIRASVVVYPGPLANMTESFARLIREPTGCFEQTSATTFPMTMALQYFQRHPGARAELVKSAKEKLEKGYQRLLGYETPEQGFEWFGKSPAHGGLTAFALLSFTEMRQVIEVDGAMLARTRNWLLKQRDGRGGFTPPGDQADTSNAYITWALLESAPRPADMARNLEREVAFVKKSAAKSSNSYVTALAANVLSLTGDHAGAKVLMAQLARRQGKTGEVEGGSQSVVGSTGQSLLIETTALAMLAWLREPAYLTNARQALKFLARSNDGGRFGSTQGTVLALRAILAYDVHAMKPAPGKVGLFVEDVLVGEPVSFEASAQETLKLPDMSGLLGPGGRRVELRMEGSSELPYSVEVTYTSRMPRDSEKSLVALEVSLSKQQLTEGEPIEARVMVLNRTNQALPSTMAIFGVPGGLEVRHDQLKELVTRGLVDAYEVRGRDVVFYWRGFKPRMRLEVPLSLVATVPGTYTGPPSRAYLYYADEHKVWAEGLKVSITPKT
ncbi:A-macroglobulin complement component [Myxococcus llanfairpwllgwyngyllgogerychwyrndrobwllllantysiliogogogochensis]|uniref:A-macroglobulin complement component n=1 Tax=Myxococcus llanfairpwllgwyngyllgogerychwyrndrobwllllantysiliogogogochensis TaxID=2590453 RepID=A0A540X6T8_9BACT|nr:alpha-2-macroglobulin family protein [Myxococcus llanfairpwllgwyngyllgogerychwyrndrobwllllantysiliogogogochensis]TQF17016.1 A-macroglobulin complement component [Myxococcus llanfairpwllgwyngyllgogerychwyrndrobwllllantysiliogogogochensis]